MDAVLKPIQIAQRDYPTPTHPLTQVTPDGVWYDRVAHLPGLNTPDVQDWVKRHTDDRTGVAVMAALSRGTDMGQVGDPTDVLDLALSRADVTAIRQAAQDELRERLEPLGLRVDHLGGPRHIKVNSDTARKHWDEILRWVEEEGGSVTIEDYHRPVTRLRFDAEALAHADLTMRDTHLRFSPDVDAWGNTIPRIE